MHQPLFPTSTDNQNCIYTHHHHHSLTHSVSLYRSISLIMHFRVILAFICLFFFFSLSKYAGAELTVLPGQPINVSFMQESGYIVTDATQGRALFYYFVGADSANPLSLPLTLWLNGGLRLFQHLLFNILNSFRR